MPGVDAARLMRDRHFHHGLCQVEADLRSLHTDSSFNRGLLGPFKDAGTLVPFGGGVHPIT